MPASLMESFLEDYVANRWRPAELPAGVDCDGVYLGSALGGAIEVVYLRAHERPRLDDLRRTWRDRSASRPTPVLVVAAYQDDGAVRADVVGLRDDRAAQRGLDLAHVERLSSVALEAGTTAEAERLLSSLFEEPADVAVPGLRNEGLFAGHELDENVPARADWPTAVSRSRAVRERRGLDLLTALGWRHSPRGSTSYLLADQGSPRAVAVLLQGEEVFDRRAGRFGDASPVEHGLALALSEGLPWVVAVQGDTVRLYAASPDVGVGRKGATTTFTELRLRVLPEDRLGYVHLLLTPQALAEGGSVQQILDSSADHATGLGARLRDRVYADVVPRLAETVAQRFGATSEGELREAYHVTLVVLFRLLFVAYAEDRGLLPYRTNAGYTRQALKTRAREYTDALADHGVVPFGDHADGLWQGLTEIWQAVDRGNPEWGVPAYSGGLFATGDDRGRAVARLRLTDAEIGPALEKLLVDTGRDGTRGPVDFQALSVREFGTIYEGLLESSLSLAPSDLALDAKSNYVPARAADAVVVAAGAVYFHNASGARKATGSYFTKQFTVEHLLGTALDPAIDDHLARVAVRLDAGDEAGAGEVFFDFRVADIAMGSGHFLVGAIDHIALRMSAFLSARPIPAVGAELVRLRAGAVERLDAVGVTELPEIDQASLLRRQVARRCIYGVDLNQIAVDLARLALWIHTFVPGLPMSSLEHGLVQGNSLTGIGTLPEALDVLTAASAGRGTRAAGAGQMSLFEEPILDALQQARAVLARVSRTAEATAAEVAEAATAYAEALERSEPARALLDAAVAGRLGMIDLRLLSALGPDAVMAAGRSPAVRERMAQLEALHFPVAFPEVFLRERAGFDVILGNPPWEELQVEELKFWVREVEGLKAKKPQEQRRIMEELRDERPALYAEYFKERAAAEAMRPVLLAGPFPGLGTGDLDLYRVFAWRQWGGLSPDGRAGIVLPRSAFQADGSALWRQELTAHGTFERVEFLTNTQKWIFDEVHGQYTVALATWSRRRTGHLSFSGPYHSLREFSQQGDRSTSVPVAEFTTWSSNLGFPLLPSPASGHVFRKLRAHPRFDAWGDYRAVREFDATNDRKTFDAGERSPESIPVFSGRTFELWFPDTGQYYAWADPSVVETALQRKRSNQQRNKRTAFYGLPDAWVGDPATLPMHRARIAFRDVTNQTNTRTVITALLPPEIVITNQAPWLFSRRADASADAYLLAVLSSIALDWYARRWVELHVNVHILNGLPVPDAAEDDLRRRRIVAVAGRLAAVDDRYAAWAAQVGVPVGSVTDSAEKTDLIAELDALVCLLYGLERVDVRHIFETFHRGWDFRSRLAAVLAHYDRWSAA